MWMVTKETARRSLTPRFAWICQTFSRGFLPSTTKNRRKQRNRQKEIEEENRRNRRNRRRRVCHVGPICVVFVSQCCRFRQTFHRLRQKNSSISSILSTLSSLGEGGLDSPSAIFPELLAVGGGGEGTVLGLVWQVGTMARMGGGQRGATRGPTVQGGVGGGCSDPRPVDLALQSILQSQG